MTTGDSARALLDRLDATTPDAGRLARLAALAARIEPELLRALRLRIVSGASVSAEGDLWFSDLVETRSLSTITFVKGVLPALRAWSVENPSRVDEAVKVIAAVHAPSSPLVHLEERLIAAGVRGAIDVIDHELSAVTAALVADETRASDLSSWALRALPRLPEACHQRGSYWTLLFAASGRRPDVTISISDLPSSEVFDSVFADAFAGTESVNIGMRWRGDGLELRVVPEGVESQLRLPATRPLVVQVSSALPSTTVGVPNDRWARVKVAGTVARVRAVDGTEYRIVAGPSVPQPSGASLADVPGLVTIARGRGRRIGIGYLIAPRLIATASRTVPADGGPQVRVEIARREYIAAVAARDVQRDVAILKLETPVPSVRPFELSSKRPAPGVKWTSFSFGRNAVRTELRGHFATIAAMGFGVGDRLSLIPEINVPIGSAAGSPILVDGKIVGHLTGERGSGAILTATPAHHVSHVAAQVEARIDDDPVEGRDWAIVVGISHYASLPALQSPEIDAQAFTDWLASRTGGNVPRENISLILSSQFGARAEPGEDELSFEPTAATIARPFNRLMAAALRSTSTTPRLGRRLYIYFSGHGLHDDTLDEPPLLAPANTLNGVTMEGVSGARFARWFRDTHAFSEIILFLDCSGSPEARGSAWPVAPPAPAPDSERVQTFYAWADYSIEAAVGAPPAFRGVFSYAVLEALSGGATNRSGQITARDVSQYIRSRVPSLVGENVRPHLLQEPRVSFSGPNDDIVLVRRAAPSVVNATIAFAPSLSGARAELLDGTLSVVSTVIVGGAPWQLSLAPGLYLVRVKDKTTTFQALPGQAVSVAVDG